MQPREYFPLGKAYGEAFCNRLVETEMLMGHIKNGKHTFLVAPRRYGKSSLCETVFSKVGIPGAKIDFHLAINEDDAQRFIVHGIAELIGKAIGQVDKLQMLISRFLKTLKPKLALGGDAMRLELEINPSCTPAENVAEAILLLDKLLIEKKQRAVMLLDEFQEVGAIAKGKGIEGAIRSAAQETKNLAFIFSGSNPHLLQTMFEDERRPLYKLCRKLVLPKISREHYEIHLNKIATLTWKKPLPIEVFDRIMVLTQRHPHYVNYLCDIIWSYAKTAPTLTIVEAAWRLLLDEERSDLIKDFLSLPDNQRKIMKYMAANDGANLYSTKAARAMDIASGSINGAIEFLLEKDFIILDGSERKSYIFINPLYQALLSDS